MWSSTYILIWMVGGAGITGGTWTRRSSYWNTSIGTYLKAPVMEFLLLKPMPPTDQQRKKSFLWRCLTICKQETYLGKLRISSSRRNRNNWKWYVELAFVGGVLHHVTLFPTLPIGENRNLWVHCCSRLNLLRRKRRYKRSVHGIV